MAEVQAHTPPKGHHEFLHKVEQGAVLAAAALAGAALGGTIMGKAANSHINAKVDGAKSSLNGGLQTIADNLKAKMK